jgi:outer membrane protein OmpA-like peptidoglycan-associated protein
MIKHWLICLILLSPTHLEAEEFFYKHNTGDKYRVLSTVNEDVYVNRRLSHRAQILNRIAVEVTKAEQGIGTHSAVFLTAERGLDDSVEPSANLDIENSFQWEREYESEFLRDKQGRITIDKRYFMPVVRNVPLFPEKDLKPGDTWSAEGHEMHDFRDGFGIPEPYRIPFTANYTFLGNREWRGQSYPAFTVSYRIFIEPETGSPETLRPLRIIGASDQIVYWDTALGQPVAYGEQFRMIFELSDGRTIEFRGSAEAEIVESPSMDKESLVRELTEELERMGIKDASVRISDDGVTLSLENIQFLGDSAVLLSGEQAKLEQIGRLLLRYKERDILVAGHTALSGTQDERARLSRERASVVADYLIDNGIRSPERIVVRGYGAERPVADNRTEAGRRQNRRVEITLLEN